MNVEITRFSIDERAPQFGILRIDDKFVCFTFERPWLDNQRDVSCIPWGVYRCFKVLNRKTHNGSLIPLTFEVVGVVGRSGILFHTGNYLSDTKGCILPCLGFNTEPISAFSSGVNSRIAFTKFLNAVKEVGQFELTISAL